MWDGPGQDPGGGSSPPPSSSHHLSDLQDQFQQQEVLIAQLKEMIRKSEQSSVTQEKVDEYMNTLSRRSAKAKKTTRTDPDDNNTKSSDFPASQKISLLRQQVEENKLRLAERGKSKKGIEDMVTQLKAQLDDSQHSIQTSFNISVQDTSKLDYTENSSSQELYSVLLSKEKRISDLLAKVQKLETNVIDLQDNVKEKDSVIDARTKAITLMTENLSRKGKTTLDALDDTKEQMRKMQENFVSLEAEMKARQLKLLEDLKLKNYEIAELEESNSRLQSEKQSLQNENIQLREKLENNEEIRVLKEKIKELEEVKAEIPSRNSPQRSSKKKGKKGGNNKSQIVQGDVQDSSSKTEIEDLSAKLRESEEIIKTLTAEIELWKQKESEFESKIKELNQELANFNTKEETDDVAKLKKQLDESNKNMIKVKAQHKSKIKELQKKVDAFKKISDTNSEIVRLEGENCKLNQKLAELEEEKGSLQLKLVESDSVKVSEPTEHEKELEEQILDHQQTVEEKDKIISILESDITNAKNEIETLSEKLNSLSHLENAQVTSEMASIQYEEQMDSLENEKKQLMIVNENFEKEREDLLEKINEIKKEKQEISIKLEHYIQENIELIDKLEKLSAEKVSSAESIEIVEGLTQQEKLELEAYQKNLDLVSGNLKTSEENLPQADLNESVNELTEETSELLQKIELFTVERREVMEKMEELKHENNSLNMKIKEIENNRDVLVETYEQLQTEKEEVDEKFEATSKENEELREKLNNSSGNVDPGLTSKFIDEINELKSEIDGYKTKLEEKEADLDSLAHIVKELQDKLEEQEAEKSQLNNNLIDINRILKEMEVDYSLLQKRVQELEDHNASLSQLLEKSQEELESVNNAEWDHKRLIDSKDNEIAKLQKERENTESVIADLQRTIQEKDDQVQKITHDLKEKYLALQKQLEQNSGDLDGIKQPLEAKISELTNKNKEQLDKMKKIAANLKKKTQSYQELEENFKNNQEKWERERSEKETQISESAEKVSSLLQQLQELESEITKLQENLSEKSRDYDQLLSDYNQFRNQKLEELRSFEEKNIDLQNIIAELRIKAEKANELSLQQELMQTQEPVQEQISSNESFQQSKIQELEMIVETQESEIVKYKERVSRLEEGISFVEERRLSLERKANEIGAQLEEKSVTCDEISQSEDRLEKRLKALTAHDEAIEKKLQETLEENQDLTQTNQKISEKNEKLKKKLAQTLEKIKEYEGQQNIAVELENQNDELKKQIHASENELRNLQGEYGRILEEAKSDLERLNTDWQLQFDAVFHEKNEFMVKCEKLTEEIKEINEYKVKLDNNQTEIRNDEEKISLLESENREIIQQLQELQTLKETILEQNIKIQNFEKQNAPQNQNALSSFFDEVPLEVSNIDSEKLRLEEEVRNLRQELDEVRKSSHQAPNSLSSFFDSPQHHQQDSVVNTEVEELKQRLQTVQLENSRFSEELSAKLEIVEGERARLEQELIAAKNQLPSQAPQVQVEVEDQDPPPVPTFLWSEQNNDPFAFVSTEPVQETIIQHQQQEMSATVPPPPPPPSSNSSGNTEEELLNKIKTLEFMLYSVEKEKDDALLQCHELSNELTRLVYKTENLTQSQVANVESQIETVQDVPDSSKQELQNIEFEKTRPAPITSLEGGPVVEEFIQPSTAYVCHADSEVNPIESQIITNFEETPQSQQELRNIEFQPTTQPMQIDGVVQEPAMTSQDAYLCFEGNNRDTFGENDDGWGFSTEDDFVQSMEISPIEELRLKIQSLESERAGHLEEIKQLQVKSGKLVKKLKEFKAKNEQLTNANKKSQDDFFNLDDTIQEELKLQIQQIEKKLKETQSELEKEKNEKVSSQKRVDVLTSANERMVEMKEKQDIEMLGWQRNCRDLQEKLEKFEWGTDDSFSQESGSKQDPEKSPSKQSTTEMSKKIEELNETIKELTLDNEELQTLLEEQRTLRLNAEKTKTVEPIPENMKTEAEYLQIVAEKETLLQQINANSDEKKELQNELNNLIKTNSELLEKFKSIEKESEELNLLISNKDEIINQLNNTLLVLEQEKAQVLDLLKTTETEKNKLVESSSVLYENQEKITELSKEKEVLFQELQTRNIQVETMQETLNSKMVQLQTELDQEIEKAQKLLSENNSLTATISQRDEEISRLGQELAAKNTEISGIIQQMNQEWELRVDQRGSDVAESWKLHLDSRETEFSQLEQVLRKEINELEEKSISLVNENNELRKNVDAEIRNEVDRISALQQQINDRQNYINELSKQLQEKQTEFEQLQQEFVLCKTTLDEEQRLTSEILQIVHVQDKNTVANEIRNQIEKIQEKQNEVDVLRQQLDILQVNFAQLQEQSNKKEEELSGVRVKAEEYRVQLETLKDNHVTLQQTVADHNHTIANLTELLQQVQNLKDYESENTQNLQHNVSEYQELNSELSDQLQEKTTQLEQVLQRFEELQRVLNEREAELNGIKSLGDEKEREYTYALENINQENKIALNDQIQKVDGLKRRLLENEDHYEELLAGKDSEIESLHYQLNEEKNKQNQVETLGTELQIKCDENSALQLRINEQNALLDEEARQISELRGIIENQVIKIEEIKKELFEKSNDFDSIIAEMDISRINQKTAIDVTEKQSSSTLDEEDLTEPVRRAELDLALYMLHQRDVRCEELTVELTQLLEERDTLQLRLSNALREKEEIVRKFNTDSISSNSENPIISEASGAIPKNRQDVEVLEQTQQQSNLDPLATKLSELRTMGYRKDKTFVDEQELRQFQQLSIMQQHRNDASKLPPEAAARLVDASYTLSRDVQSPSKVLLNWLWGRSTPKVNNI